MDANKREYQDGSIRVHLRPFAVLHSFVGIGPMRLKSEYEHQRSLFVDSDLMALFDGRLLILI